MTAAEKTAVWLDKLNFRIPEKTTANLWRDDIVPPFIKHDAQDALARLYTRTLPFLQQNSPAELIADALSSYLSKLDLETSKWSIIDFGSGQGGPIPIIEKIINHGRDSPIPFILTDLHPNLDVWMELATRSRALSFIPQPVDAANPRYAAISTTTRGDRQAALRAGFESNGRKVFRLFSESFHRFDDEYAIEVLKSTLETADAFAVVELQERRLFALVGVLLETYLFLLLGWLWFWEDKVHLALIYLIPVLPVMQSLDGFVRCFRTRTFGDMITLVEQAFGTRYVVDREGSDGAVQINGWEFRHHRVRHTWPFGYINVVVGTSLWSLDKANLAVSSRR
ncbi:hypothetical protein AC579_5000 [Pseudocercospora musae]|uniref:Histidine-specific methyltransferase SAM-dependent domain-containing protein n=1 Tax=Pseudocercospora musae TaxID=113226 RepID=A0A139IG19_9PEZI|nr:hypothetical protein AC579_5000 [Pseudocercospora musae]